MDFLASTVQMKILIGFENSTWYYKLVTFLVYFYYIQMAIALSGKEKRYKIAMGFRRTFEACELIFALFLSKRWKRQLANQLQWIKIIRPNSKMSDKIQHTKIEIVKLFLSYHETVFILFNIFLLKVFDSFEYLQESLVTDPMDETLFAFNVSTDIMFFTITTNIILPFRVKNPNKNSFFADKFNQPLSKVVVIKQSSLLGLRLLPNATWAKIQRPEK
eukprot:snap_masked-scaffold_15-processed-gene-8.25-mRNA-1 protein AED:1.00 eAED:1.00 QI:0/-1/0/0/-1/1/1/0/217